MASKIAKMESPGIQKYGDMEIQKYDMGSYAEWGFFHVLFIHRIFRPSNIFGEWPGSLKEKYV
jgi:hypothetical protein